MRLLFAILLGLSIFGVAHAQTTPVPNSVNGSVKQRGAVVANHCAKWFGNNVVVDSGATCGSGSGSVTQFNFTDQNGVTGIVTNATTTPTLALTLGAITPTSVNGLTLSATTTGVLTSNGTGVISSSATVPVANGGTASTTKGAALDNLLSATTTQVNPQEFWRTGTATYASQNRYIFNNDPTYLSHWRAALGKVRAGTANARIMVIGDSTVFGYGSNGAGSGNMPPLSFPTQLSNYFNSIGINANWNGWYGAGGNLYRPTYDTRITAGTGWLQGSSSGSGTAFGGGVINNLPAFGGGTGTLAFTPTTQVDTFVIKYWRSTSSPVGNFNVNIDGGANTVLSSSGSAAMLSATITGTLGTHTFNVLSDNTVNIWVHGIEAYNSAVKTVSILNAGSGGSQTGNWNLSANFWNGVPALQTFAPDLTIIELDINDWNNSVVLATNLANLQALITAGKVSGDVVLVSPNPSNTSGFAAQATQLTYIQNLYTLAATNNVPLVDNFSRLVSYAVSNPLALYFDSLHPNGAGYADIAQGVFNLIGQP